MKINPSLTPWKLRGKVTHLFDLAGQKIHAMEFALLIQRLAEGKWILRFAQNDKLF